MELFAKQAAECGWKLSDLQIDQFARYQDLLIEWNRRMNLTAVREPVLIQQRHFLESLSCATVTGDLNGFVLADVGTGAGFPGLPLKILFPDLSLTLIDSVAKKARFLEMVVAVLELPKVTVLTERVEVLGHLPEHREHYDWVVARGLARLNVLMEYLLPLCQVGGSVLAQKGKHAKVEAEEAASAISILGGAAPAFCDGLSKRRVLVTVKKIAETPARYPRRTGIPSKRPL
jgi:16S rRNA (guanine527-N7)-methyltransferase